MTTVESRETTTAGTAGGSEGWRALRDAGSLLAVAAISLYAIAYFTQYSFYETFGVTPDEVGLDKVSALLRLIPLIFTIVLAILVVAVAFMGLGGPHKRCTAAAFDAPTVLRGHQHPRRHRTMVRPGTQAVRNRRAHLR